MNQIKLIKLTRELPFHLCTFPRWSLCTWLPVGFDRCCLQAYRHIAGTVSNRPVHRVHTIRRRNRLPRSPTLSDLCVSMCISVLSNQQSYPCIRCDKTSCSSDPLKRRINRCTRENVCSEKRNNCIAEQWRKLFLTQFVYRARFGNNCHSWPFIEIRWALSIRFRDYGNRVVFLGRPKNRTSADNRQIRVIFLDSFQAIVLTLF